MTAMNQLSSVALCQAIYDAPNISAADKLVGMARILGFERPAQTAPAVRNAPAAAPSRRQRTAATAAPSGRRNRVRAGTGELTPFQRQVLAAIPETGGIQQSAIAVPGRTPTLIGRALATLRERGMLIAQNGVWERASQADRAAPPERRAA